MQLIGRYSSPYVRRVAVTMGFYGIDCAHANLTPFGEEKADVRKFNPLGRVPALVLDDGEQITDSGAIIDYLDGFVGAGQSLTPFAGALRREALNVIAVASGTTDKLVSALYEHHFRPKDMIYRPWVEMCERQVVDGFQWLDQRLTDTWFVDGRMTQADISVAVFWQFGQGKRPGFFGRMNCQCLQSLSDRLAETKAFQRTVPGEGLPKGIALG
jgi:glutathione S-transferase